uniref:Uncharacterized protein n=1 Tax=Arundo donax TaxID=35708 RepID=A0A0A8YDY4_ARUDO
MPPLLAHTWNGFCCGAGS